MSENDKYYQTLREFHNTYAQDFQKIEQNYIELIVAVISALSIYGYGLKEFLYKIGECSEQAFILFTITTFGTNILLLIVYFVSNIKAYQARQLQIIVFQIEKALGTIKYKYKPNQDQFFKEVIPAKWNPCVEEEQQTEFSQNLSENLRERQKIKPYLSPPEIYQFFKFVSAFLLVVGDIVYYQLIRHYDLLSSYSSFFYMMIKRIFLFLLLFLLCGILKFRWNFSCFSNCKFFKIGFSKIVCILCVICFLIGIFLIWLLFNTTVNIAIKFLNNEIIAILMVSLLLLFVICFIIYTIDYCCCKNFFSSRDFISLKSYSGKLKELCEYWYRDDC